MPKGTPKKGFRQQNSGVTAMEFSIPDPAKFRISDCGMYLIEKIQLGQETPVYAVWEYKRVLYGLPTAEDAIAAIKNREGDRREAEEKYWASREPDAKLVSHRGIYTSASLTSSESR